MTIAKTTSIRVEELTNVIVVFAGEASERGSDRLLVATGKEN